MQSCDLYLVSNVSDAANDLARTEATGANIHLLRPAVNDDVNALDVGRPATLGLAVGVAHEVTRHDTLLADFTILTHKSPPPL